MKRIDAPDRRISPASMSWRRLLSCCRVMAMIPILCTPVSAQAPDLTAGGVPTDTVYWNLGPTGMQGWFYHSGASTGGSRQIQVKVVAAGSPADGILAVNDVILGADGTGAEPVNFTSDARKALAYAIADAEARTPASLKLLRWRAGITTTVSLTLETLGAYSATAPYNCPKSAAILEKGVARIMETGETGGYGFSTMTLLASNNPANPANAARQARAVTEARALNLTPAQIAQYTSGNSSHGVSKPWNIGHQLMMQAEYYLQTGDALVLPSIRARAILAANGQSMFGTTGHQFAKPGAYGEVNGSYGVGYGTVNNANMGCFTGLVLAQKCGLDDPEILAGIERASRFYGGYVNRGSIPYGEHQPGGGHESNGKCGQAALAFLLKGDRPDAATFFAKMATASGNSRDGGHTGPYFNYQWAPLGANAGGEQTMSAYFSRASWMYDLARKWNGSFEYNTYGQGTNGGSDWSSANFQMSTAILLTYALPLRQTYLTGKNQNPAHWLSQSDAEAAAVAADYNAASRTTGQLLADLGSWSPPNRRSAANEIGNRTAEHAGLLPTLHTMANTDPNLSARIGACFALGEIASDSSCAVIAGLLTDPENLVRWASAAIISKFSQTARMAQLNVMLAACASTAKPLLPLDPDDPVHLAHAFLVPSVFGNGGAGAPRGVLYQHNLIGVDRNLLYPALRAAAATPTGIARSTISVIYPYLSKADIEAIAGSVVDATMYEAPADRMFAGSARTGGLTVLKSHNISEGVPLSIIVANETSAEAGLGTLEDYAGSSLSVKPDPQVVEFCQMLIANGSSVEDAQLVLGAITADQLPDKVTPFKSIDWIFPDDASFNLPKKQTVLRVQSTDHAAGDSVYTWRKVHGAGNVTFTPNDTASAKDTTVVFEGVPGIYLFEVTMSDSRGLTEVSKNVSVTLRDAGGNLPSNAAPAANPQSITAGQGAPAHIILTGADPEGFALNYSVTSQPAHGTLSGTPPHLIYTAKADYAGPDSLTFEVMDSAGQVDTAAVNITVIALSGVGLAVYEPFQYPAGAFNGTSGSSEIGFTGSWNASTGISLVAQSLPFGSLKTAGGSLGNMTSGNGFGGKRSLNAAALAGNGLLDDGATLWFSMVVGHPGNNYLQKIHVALANNPFSTTTNNYSIINDGALLGSGVGISLESSALVATQFRDSSYGTGATAHVFGNWSAHQGSMLSSQHRLVVGRITWGAASDKIEIFLPYDDMLLPSVPSSALTVNVDQSTFDTLTFSRSGNPLLDEIRFGATYQSVLQGTAAMSGDLTAPTPDPTNFAVAPAPSGPSSITMVAAPAHDNLAVEYYFTCTAGGGNDSAWQDSVTYTDSGLTPGVSYHYTVKARDKHPGLNETQPSVAASATIPLLGTVPDVTGLSQTTAESLVSGAFFTLGSVTTATGHSLTIPAGHVLGQTPAGASATAYGSSVDLVISIGADPVLPTLETIVDDRSGSPLQINFPVTYTLTFNEDMNGATVDGTDFTNAGSAAISIGTITQTAPGVFTVMVTPTSAGILRFAVASGAVLQDAQGDALNTSAAIIDDTVITVNLPPVTVPNVVGMTQSAAEAAIVAGNLVVGSTYQIYDGIVAAGKVISQNPAGGSSNPEESRVEIVVSLGPPPDTSGPVIATLRPADGVNHIEVNDKLVVYFDEDVVAGSGNIIIRNLGDYSESSISINDSSQVFISGVVLTIDPTSDFLAGKSYAVRIAPGAVQDLSGNPFSGITDNATWNFSTSLTPNQTLLFNEDFELPNVTGYTQGASPTRWVRANQGSSSSLHGLTDKSGGNFDAADPNHQAYAFRYTNTGLTTAEGVIGTIAEGVTYRVELDVIRDSGALPGLPYNVRLLAYSPGAARNDIRNNGTAIQLATLTGNATDNGGFSTVSFQYTVPVGSSAIGKDLAVRLIGATNSAIIDNVVVKTVIPNLPDVLPPVVTEFIPVDGTTSFPVDANLVLHFNENIIKGSGVITLKNLTDGTETNISVLSGTQVIVTGSTLTINPAEDLLVDKFYAVRISANAIYDAASNSFEGIHRDTLWGFVTGEINDDTPPLLVALDPADGASDVPYGANLRMTFDESVVAGEGFITLKNLSDTSELMIDVNDESQVSFHGAVVTINPVNYLAEGRNYAIRIDADAILDLPGNPFAGVDNDTTWNFSTSAINPPTVVSLDPVDEAVGIDPQADLTVLFDEHVTAGSGIITIKNLSDATQTLININDGSQVSFNGPVLTINPSTDFASGKNYAVLIGAGAVLDLDGNLFAGITNDATWNFITGVSSVGLIFVEDFEVASGSPNVDATGSLGNTSKKTGTKWQRATDGFGSGDQGIVDESSGQFIDPTGEQAYAFRYTNSGITSKEAMIGSLAVGQTYSVSFHVVKDGLNDGSSYNVGLVTFAPGATRTSAIAMGNGTSKILSQVSSTHSGTNYRLVTFQYTVGTADAAVVGHDVAIRVKGASNSANIDNVQVNVTGTGSGQVDHFVISPIASPQTVGTPITGITLTAKDSSEATVTGFTGTVTFGGTGGFTGTSAIFTAGVLSGVSVLPTVAGGNLTLTVTDGASHTGSATIATINPAVSVYETWSDGAPFDADANGDGVDNGIAWLLGSGNPAATANARLPAASLNGGNLRLTFRCLKSTARGGVELKLQSSNDLGASDLWTTHEASVPDSTDTVNGVVFTITEDGDHINVTADIPTAGNKLFTRLVAIEP